MVLFGISIIHMKIMDIPPIYENIVNDVIDNCSAIFSEEKCSETILDRLKHLWIQKLAANADNFVDLDSLCVNQKEKITKPKAKVLKVKKKEVKENFYSADEHLKPCNKNMPDISFYAKDTCTDILSQNEDVDTSLNTVVTKSKKGKKLQLKQNNLLNASSTITNRSYNSNTSIKSDFSLTSSPVTLMKRKSTNVGHRKRRYSFIQLQPEETVLKIKKKVKKLCLTENKEILNMNANSISMRTRSANSISTRTRGAKLKKRNQTAINSSSKCNENGLNLSGTRICKKTNHFAESNKRINDQKIINVSSVNECNAGGEFLKHKQDIVNGLSLNTPSTLNCLKTKCQYNNKYNNIDNGISKQINGHKHFLKKKTQSKIILKREWVGVNASKPQLTTIHRPKYNYVFRNYHRPVENLLAFQKVKIILPRKLGHSIDQRTCVIKVPAWSLQGDQLPTLVTPLIEEVCNLTLSEATSTLQQYFNNYNNVLQVDGGGVKFNVKPSTRYGSVRIAKNIVMDTSDVNTDDDLSDAENPSTAFECRNKIMCQFDLIKSNRNKWFIYLKNGIMHLNGKDYMFKMIQGTVAW